jgi:GMP synthase (glutamine-hydrolysing)
VLGICYGMQTMAVQLGGQVGWSDQREFGYAEVRALGHTQLLSGLQDFFHDGHAMLKVWMSHGDKVTQLPAGFKLMAATPSCPIAGMADEQRRFYAVQFHPEVDAHPAGQRMLAPLRARHRRLRGRLADGSYIDEAVARIRAQVGDEEVICGPVGRGRFVAWRRPSSTARSASS